MPPSPSGNRRYSPLVPSPLNPESSHNGPSFRSASPTSLNPAGHNIKLARKPIPSISPAQYLLRQKAAAAWRSVTATARYGRPQTTRYEEERSSLLLQGGFAEKPGNDDGAIHLSISEGLDSEGDIGLVASDKESCWLSPDDTASLLRTPDGIRVDSRESRIFAIETTSPVRRRCTSGTVIRRIACVIGLLCTVALVHALFIVHRVLAEREEA